MICFPGVERTLLSGSLGRRSMEAALNARASPQPDHSVRWRLRLLQPADSIRS